MATSAAVAAAFTPPAAATSPRAVKSLAAVRPAMSSALGGEVAHRRVFAEECVEFGRGRC